MATEERQTMEQLMNEIREVTKNQKSASRVDEIRVMRTMLNDPEFAVSIYDKNKGYIGTRCPREEAVKFITNVSSSITGLDIKSAAELANSYEFTKRDATFLIENSRDFTSTYLATGRKLPIMQSEKSEASILLRHVDKRDKNVPNANNGVTKVPAFDKVICRSKSPKYNTL